MIETDVLIIGAGAVGTAIARELSRYQIDVMVVDKNDDVGGDASKSNSAIIHTGFDATPGTLESELVVAANPMYDQLCRELDIPFRRIGAIMPAVNSEQYEALGAIQAKARRNRVYDVTYLTAEQIRALEPEINPEVLGGLYIPRESIIDPFILVVAQAENAATNGVRFLCSTAVIGLDIVAGTIRTVQTTRGSIHARHVINAAGLYSDQIAAFAGKGDFKVNPRKGQFYILDKNTPYRVASIILPIPTKLTKGKLICPTIHGNLLVGPTAEELEDKTDKAVTRDGLAEVASGVRKLVPRMSERNAITEYCGLRPNRTPEGYHIDQYSDLPGLINISGIRSTGVTSSVALAKYVADRLADQGLKLEPKVDFKPNRIGIKKFAGLSVDEQDRLIGENPLYGQIVCRCETITAAEIVEAIRRPVGARSLDAVKRRVRAGMGRCGGGFCSPKIIEILAHELGVPVESVCKNQPGSELVVAQLRA